MINKIHLVLLFILVANLIFANKNNEVQNIDTLVVGYTINAPFINYENGKLEGLSYRLWQRITQQDSTPYQLKEYSLENLLSGLSNGTIDICLSPLTITSNRSKTIDFSTPYYIAYSGGMIKETSNWESIENFLSTFFNPIFFKIIASLFFILILFGVLVWIFERKNNPEEFGGSKLHGIWHGFWWSAVTMTTVGYGDKSPRSLGGKIIALIWMFIAIILISVFTASITSHLTIRKLTWSKVEINSYKKQALGTIKDSATEKWLIKNYFNSNLKTYQTFDDMVEALEKNEIKVLVYDEPLLQYAIKNDHGDRFDLLDLSFNESMYAMGFSKKLNDKIKDELSSKILSFTETSDWKVMLSEFDLQKDK